MLVSVAGQTLRNWEEGFATHLLASQRSSQFDTLLGNSTPRKEHDPCADPDENLVSGKPDHGHAVAARIHAESLTDPLEKEQHSAAPIASPGNMGRN